VLGAILVSFLCELCAQGLAVGYAVVWTCAVSLSWKHIKTSPQLQLLLGWGVAHNWPESLIYATTIYIVALAGIVWVGLGLYLAVVRSFDLRRLVRGLLVSLFIVFIAHVSGIFLSGAHPSRLVDHLVAWLPLFLALLLSMWTARPAGRAVEQ
jgi:hypothetical protein